MTLDAHTRVKEDSAFSPQHSQVEGFVPDRVVRVEESVRSQTAISHLQGNERVNKLLAAT